MKLGIIGGWSEESFAHVHSLGLKYIEFCYNVGRNTDDILALIPDIRKWQDIYGVSVSSVGRWGSERLLPDGSVNEAEYRSDLALIDLASQVGCPVFNCGVNPVAGMNFEDNAELAVGYLAKLIEFGASRGVKIAVYNCDWGNIIYDARGWDLVLPRLPELGIKYDTSHCINRGGDALTEMYRYGDRIFHFHVKGTINLNGKHIDDPPAGLDLTPWGAVFDMLYLHNYEGVCSIEPHSRVWKNSARGEWGVHFTIDYISRFIMPENSGDVPDQYMP